MIAMLAFVLCGCGEPQPDPTTPEGVADSCEGGLAEVDGTCVVLQHALDVLIFRTTNGPYASTCVQRITSDDPGIDQAVIAESGGCRVIDTERYGPPNFEAAPREPGVSLVRGDDVVPIDEAELFESCLERRTAPDGFFDYGGAITARFDGSSTIPPFDNEIDVPADPGFTRGPVVADGPLEFTWTDDGAESALVVIAEFPVQIVCPVAPAAGRFEVPGELMAMLPDSDPPGLEPLTSIRLRNRVVLPFPAADAVVTLTADAYQSAF